MKKLSTILIALLSASSWAINVTNYPIRTVAQPTDWFWLSSVPDKTNYNFPWLYFLSQIKSEVAHSPTVAAGTGVTAVTNASGLVTFSVASNPPYTAPIIDSFVNNQGGSEAGTVINSTLLTWSLSGGPITGQLIDPGAVAIGNLSQRTYTDTTSYSTDRTYTLTVSDGVTTPTATTSVAFSWRRYWGTSANTNLSNSAILGLTNELSSTLSKTWTATPNLEYIFYAYPSSWGPASFIVNTFNSTSWTLTIQSVTNTLGAVNTYNVYRSNNILLGSYNIQTHP